MQIKRNLYQVQTPSCSYTYMDMAMKDMADGYGNEACI